MVYSAGEFFDFYFADLFIGAIAVMRRPRFNSFVSSFHFQIKLFELHRLKK